LERKAAEQSAPAATEMSRPRPAPPPFRHVEAAPTASDAPSGPATGNGRHESNHRLLLPLSRPDLERARRVAVTMQVEDEDREVLRSIPQLEIDLMKFASLEELLVRLSIVLTTRD
jgi:hypothetical protein